LLSAEQETALQFPDILFGSLGGLKLVLGLLDSLLGSQLLLVSNGLGLLLALLMLVHLLLKSLSLGLDFRDQSTVRLGVSGAGGTDTSTGGVRVVMAGRAHACVGIVVVTGQAARGAGLLVLASQAARLLVSLLLLVMLFAAGHDGTNRRSCGRHPR